LFIKSQFTTNAQNVRHLNQCMTGQALFWNVSILQRSWSCCKLCDKHMNGVFLLLELNALRC